MHGTEMILIYACCDGSQDHEGWISCIPSKKEEQYSFKTTDQSTIIKMNRRILMQMITPVSTWHYNSHLKINDGKWEDNI